MTKSLDLIDRYDRLCVSTATRIEMSEHPDERANAQQFASAAAREAAALPGTEGYAFLVQLHHRLRQDDDAESPGPRGAFYRLCLKGLVAEAAASSRRA